MVAEWREYRIGEIADIVGGSTPSTSDPSNFNGDIPWLTPKDLSGPHDRYVSRGERNLSWKGLESCSAQLLPAGTVLVTSRAPIGHVAIAKNPITTNQGFRNLVPKPGVDSEFLYYWVKANVEELRRHASGSTFQELSGTALAQIGIRLPPLPEQRAIAHILGTLDDKIELNRRMSETLEAMAQALFKVWFVDFEPVRAKMEGRWRRGHPLPLPLGEGRGEGPLPTKTHAKLPSDLLAFARELRRDETDAERLLWRLLRNRRLAGAKFRRQHPYPPYVLDFYCHELKLAIELDGGQHNLPESRLRDKARTAQLQAHGIRVLRFWDHEVLRQTESVLQAIYRAVIERLQELQPSPPAPLPAGEGSTPPGLPAHLYDLFPTRLVDSELGEIPEGWRVVELGQVIEINPPRVLRKGQHALYLDMASLPTRGHVPDGAVERPYTSGTRFTNGDTLLARITPCLENGTTAFVDFLEPNEVGWGSTEFIVLRPKPPLPAEFGYCLARDPDFREFAIQSMTGTSGRQRVQPEALARYLLVVPSDDVAKAFGALVEPWFRKASASERESRALAALRDALLPKLIRGEIRVKDAKRFLEKRGL